jgi:hypothetical protein
LRYSSFRLAFLALALTAGPASADGVHVFPKTAFALPMVDGIKMDWVIPPSAGQFHGKAKSARLRFDVSPDGHPWFVGGAERVLMSPNEELLVRTPGPFDDAVFLDGGAHLACTDRYLAVPHAEEKEHSKFENGVLQVQLQAILKLEHRDCRLFTGGKSLLYIVQHNDESGKDEVSTLRSGGGAPAKAEKILSTSECITALAGDGEKTYFAMGKWIMELSRGDSKAKRFYAPDEPATGLAYSTAAGVFYATKAHVGFAGPNFQMNFLTSPDPEIALRDDAVYVRLSGTLAVLKVSGAGKFKTLSWPEKPGISPAK